MKTIEELLGEWEDGALTAEGAAELKFLLSHPEARMALVDDWLVHETIYEKLREQPVAQASEQAEEMAEPSPISEAGRSWRALFPRLVWREISLPWRWAVGSALAAVTVALLLLWGMPASPRIAQCEGKLTLTRNGKSRSAGAGTALRAGDIVKVAAGQSLVVNWRGEGSSWRLEANSELEILSQGQDKRGLLRKGVIDVVAASQNPMVLLTPQAEVKGTGSRFQLSALEAATLVEVRQGEVELRPTTGNPRERVSVRVASNLTYTIEQKDPSLPDSWRVFQDGNAAPVDRVIQLPFKAGGTNPVYRIVTPWRNLLRFDAIHPQMDGCARLAFQARSNTAYTIEFTESLQPPVWRKYMDIEAARTNRLIELPVSTDTKARFYRILRPAPSSTPAPTGKLGMRPEEPLFDAPPGLTSPRKRT